MINVTSDAGYGRERTQNIIHSTFTILLSLHKLNGLRMKSHWTL